MSDTNYTEKKILDHYFGKATWTAPTIYIALSTADPGETGAGLAEPVGNNYSRVATVAGDWNAAVQGDPTVLDNLNQLNFPEASGSWGTLTHVALLDAPTGGNVLRSGALTIAKTIGAGDTPYFAAGDLDNTQD